MVLHGATWYYMVLKVHIYCPALHPCIFLACWRNSRCLSYPPASKCKYIVWYIWYKANTLLDTSNTMQIHCLIHFIQWFDRFNTMQIHYLIYVIQYKCIVYTSNTMQIHCSVDYISHCNTLKCYNAASS